MNIDLSSEERMIIIQALRFPPFKDVIQEPRTPKVVRDTYKRVIQKIGLDEVLHREIVRSIQSPNAALKNIGLRRKR